MRTILYLVAVMAFLALSVSAHRSVKSQPIEDEHEAHLHHHLQRQHRRKGGVPHKDHSVREKTHHELLREAIDPVGVRLSAHPKHRVGPRYTDRVQESHKPKARYDAKGDLIPHEIRDETVHNLHHK